MKKRIFSVFLAVIMVVLLLPVQAFAAETIKGAYVNQKFETVIDTVVGAKTFSRSGNVPDGLKLSGTWSYKNSYGDYVFKMTLEGTPTTAGTYNFSVNYKKEDGTVVKKVDYTITIGEKAPFAFAASINVDKWPNKLVYYLGDSVDLTGMIVTAVVYKYYPEENVYKPEEMDVTDLVWVEPAVFTSDEAQNVKVFFKAPGDQQGNLTTFESSFRVSFNYASPNDVTRIEIYNKPTKLTYTVGEKLDITGMTVRLHKGGGNAEDITTGFTTDVTTLDTVGTQTVTVKYIQNDKEFTATFDVTVEEKPVESSSSSSSEPEPSSNSSSEPESEPSSESESSSQPEETTSSEPESESSEPEPSSEPEVPSSEPESESSESIQVIGGNPEGPSDNDEGGIPFWVWIIIGLLVVLIGAAVALFLIGRKRLDDEY